MTVDVGFPADVLGRSADAALHLKKDDQETLLIPVSPLIVTQSTTILDVNSVPTTIIEVITIPLATLTAVAPFTNAANLTTATQVLAITIEANPPLPGHPTGITLPVAPVVVSLGSLPGAPLPSTNILGVVATTQAVMVPLGIFPVDNTLTLTLGPASENQILAITDSGQNTRGGSNTISTSSSTADVIPGVSAAPSSRLSSSNLSSAGANSTQTTASSTSPTSSPVSVVHHGLSTGAVAGVGIGCAIAGAVLAFIFFSLFMRRNKQPARGGNISSVPSHELTDLEESKGLTGVVATTKPVTGPVDDGLAVETLIDRADDSQIRKLMQDLNELIDQHVENYYHMQTVGSPAQLESSLENGGYDIDSFPEMIAILHNPRSRFAGIRRLISEIILANIEWTAKPSVSLLPPRIAALCASIPPIERHPGSREIFDGAFAKWRHLTAFLIEPARSNGEAPLANERELQPAITQNVSLLNTILTPFLKPGPDTHAQQRQNLAAIVFAAAQLGLLLFAQPAPWSLDWDSANPDDSRLLVVSPALAERVERQGMTRAREVVAPVTIRV